ncbi:hypothetical protein M0R45_013097 [Rubus argutus]|uniref:Pre-mRNA-splicing factor SYF1 central HAT repeats domain-containing protein n=1 Tax=Rubus argutus TaxID=59490 RepID=A0AAW1XI96_RUBAR
MARDVFEEAMQRVVTVRDFSVIFDSYAQFLESMLAHKMKVMEDDGDDDEEEEEEEEEDVRTNVNLAQTSLRISYSMGFWLCNDKDVDLRLARLSIS